MVNIAVCDDDIIFADSLSKTVKARFQNAGINCYVKTFYSVQGIYSAVNRKYFDILFLDIEIGKDSGIELANKIRDEQNNNKSLIVYVSNYSNYHDNKQLYGSSPIGFISKPVKDGEIERVVEIASNRILKAKPDDYFKYSFKTDNHILIKRDIFYFESSGRNMTVVTKDARASFISSMDEVRQQAAEPFFVRIHRSYIINILHLESCNGKHAIMRNGDKIPVSEGYRKEALWAIADFFDRRARNNIHA